MLRHQSHRGEGRSWGSAVAATLPRHLLLVLTVVAALTAAACGGGGQQAAEQPTAPGTDSAGEEDAGEEDTGDPQQMRIAYVPATTSLLLHVAQEQGFFEERGLEVELTEAANISEIIPALGQQFEISLGTATDLIRAADSGLDVVQISGNTISTEDNPFARLIVRADSGIEDITGLEGKTVASPTLSGVIHVATLYWAKQEGIDPSSIRGVQVPPPNHPDQLTSGQVDAVEALEPFATRLVADGNVSLGNPFAAIALPLATNFWIANQQWAQENPEAVQGFIGALEDAQGFVEENDEQARQILQGYTGMPPEVASRVPLPTFELEIREEDLDKWLQVLRDLGEFEGDVQPEDLVLSPE